MSRAVTGAVDRVPAPSHIVVCGGTLREWEATGGEEWASLIDLLARAVEGSGARWVTIVPYSGEAEEARLAELRERIATAVRGAVVGSRVNVIAPGGVVFAIDTCGSGRARLVNAVNSLPAGVALDEAMVAAAVLAPAPEDPDLVVVFGSPTVLPPSLVWELAYGEIVFFDTSWRECNVEHVHMAIDDFQRRERRFGGVDS